MRPKLLGGLLLLALTRVSQPVLGRALFPTGLATLDEIQLGIKDGITNPCLTDYCPGFDKRAFPRLPGGSSGRGGGPSGGAPGTPFGNPGGPSGTGQQYGGGVQAGGGQQQGGGAQQGGVPPQGVPAQFGGGTPNLSADRELSGLTGKPLPRGLGPVGSDKRAMWERLEQWTEDNQASMLDKHWLFYTGPDSLKGAISFKASFDPPASPFRGHQNSGDHSDNQPITYMQVSFGQVLRGPARLNTDDDSRTWIYDGAISLMTARTAAAQGGDVRILMQPQDNATPDGRFWTNFEAHELTKEGTQVQRILRYNVRDLQEESVVMWRAGDQPLGRPADFSSAPGAGLIDLSDVYKG